MAFDCTGLTPADWADNIPNQIPQLQQDMIRYNMVKSPYSAILPGGTFPNNQGTQIKTLVPSRPVTNQSLTQPNFVTFAGEACGPTGLQAQFGFTEFITALDYLEGFSPRVCVNSARASVIDSYDVAITTMRDGIKEVNDADIRNSLLTLSGVKYVANSHGGWNNLTGGYNQVGVSFVNKLPNSPTTFTMLQNLMDYSRNELRNDDLYDDGADGYFVFLCSSEQIRYLRNDAGIQADVRAQVTGNIADAAKAIRRYSFIDFPGAQGVRFGIDMQPLRFNIISNGTNTNSSGVVVPLGFPVYIEPYIKVNNDIGVQNAVNPAWTNALYETGMLVTQNTFKRLIPQQYLGEGPMKFSPQYFMGELQWNNLKNQDCNFFGDFGQFGWRIARAYQAMRPHGVIPVNYQRCQSDWGAYSCPNVSGSSDV